MPATTDTTDTIDTVNVERVTDGHARYTTLNPAERIHAYRILASRGLTIWQIAVRMDCTHTAVKRLAEAAAAAPQHTPEPAAKRAPTDTPTVTPPCRLDPDMWSDGGKDSQARAAHQCLHHCPMLQFCRQLDGVAGTVMGGVLYAKPKADGAPHRHPVQPIEQICDDCAASNHVPDARPCGVCAGPMPLGARRYCKDECRKVGDRARKRANETLRWQRQLQQRADAGELVSA